MGEIEQILKKEIETIEHLMRSQIKEYHPDLKCALEIILSSGGKRIRPKIVLLVGKLINSNEEALLLVATDIELLHTATLVHDDLIDSSFLRRGTPTLNSKWSPNATVLTGDFLFAAASDLASRANSVEVMRLFSRTLMMIVNGEVNQLFAKNWSFGTKEYSQRIYAKTASLFETSAYAPALISDIDNNKGNLLKRFGCEFGMAFQILDDILDYIGDESTIGKPIGGDLRHGLVTLPLILFIKTNPNDKLVQKIITGDRFLDDGDIQYLLETIPKSKVIQLAQDKLMEYSRRAEAYILNFPDKAEHEELIKLCKSLGYRRY